MVCRRKDIRKDFKSDSNGLDLNRQTITGDNEEYFKAMFELIEEDFLVKMNSFLNM